MKNASAAKDYSILEHTADIGLEAWGDSIADAFCAAGRGMFDIVTDGSDIECAEERTFELEADDLEELLVDFLNRLLFYSDAEFLVFGDFNVSLDEKKCRLKATAQGDEYDRSKHGYGADIKAVTYHMLEVRKPLNGESARVRVLFDV